jgi:hypothetical protein
VRGHRYEDHSPVLDKNAKPYLKNSSNEEDWGHGSSGREYALSSNSSTAKKRKKKERERERKKRQKKGGREGRKEGRKE